jgi:hypothetical protein
VVRGAAIWALTRLAPERIAGYAALCLERENDPGVRNEWMEAAGETAT